VCGYVRIAEVVQNAATGWNVHYHVILLLDGELGPPHLEGLRASVATRFTRGVADRGGHAAVDHQDLRPMRPGTEARMAGYCFKGTTMRPLTEGTRTPMTILSDLESTGEGFALWEEYSSAVSVDRRMQVITSKHIDAVCTPAAPLSC
jgi:hypothetical protein